jgi:iron complex outermembrane recepter protein
MKHDFPRIVALAAWLLPFLAVAQESREELPELLVEAIRGSVVPPHFAGSSTIIDEKTIVQSGARSVADLLASEGGVRISSTSGNLSNGSIHLRGFGENSSSRVLILVDGRPVNRPDMASVSLLEVPLSRLVQVEILRGSQTARFGDNAVGGVINLVTRSATAKPVSSIEAAGGSDGYFLARLGHSGTYEGHGISFDAERNFTDGWRDHSASEMESAGLRWNKEIARGNEWRMGLSWIDELNEFPGPLGKEEYQKDPRQSLYLQSGFGDQYFSEQETLKLDSTLLIGKGEDHFFEIPFTYSQRDQSWNLGPGSHSDNRLDQMTLTPVWRMKGQKASIEVGATFRDDSLELDQYGEIERRNLTGDAELKRQVLGGFTAIEWEPWERWHVNVAGRVERSEVEAKARSVWFPEDPELNFSRDGAETNTAWQAGIRWEPVSEIASWLRYDRLYRLPSTDEIAAYQGYPLSVPFNDQLHAETGHNVELGAEFRPGSWDFRANVFSQWLEGEIGYDYLQNLNVNFADTRRNGLEADVGYRSERWEVNMHYTYLTAKFRDGEYAGKNVYLVPRHQASAVVSVRPFEGFRFQGEYQFNGESFEGNDFENGREKLPSYGVVNLLTRYEPKPGLSFYFRVNNLLDKTYATEKYAGVWYPAAGRQYQLGVRQEF